MRVRCIDDSKILDLKDETYVYVLVEIRKWQKKVFTNHQEVDEWKIEDFKFGISKATEGPDYFLDLYFIKDLIKADYKVSHQIGIFADTFTIQHGYDFHILQQVIKCIVPSQDQYFVNNSFVDIDNPITIIGWYLWTLLNKKATVQDFKKIHTHKDFKIETLKEIYLALKNNGYFLNSWTELLNKI